jgi:tRNA U55 pseudouridine synthase TruB
LKTLQNNIPTVGKTYTKYRIITDTCILIYKKLGFTPLQVLEEVRPFLPEQGQKKVTFVGRLDPMAEGNIHLLWSGDMKEKQNIQNQDKGYIVEVLLGVKTDTGDVLGLIESKNNNYIEQSIQKFVGSFVYDYPKYSSPNIKKVLKGEKETNKKQEGYIYSIEDLGMKKNTSTELKEYIFNKLEQCNMKGDFRLNKVE